MAPALPPELLLEITDHLAGPALSFPSRPAINALLALCTASRLLSARATHHLYTAVAVPSVSALVQLSQLADAVSGLRPLRTRTGSGSGTHAVRALFLARHQLTDTHLGPAAHLLALLAPSLERIVFDGWTLDSSVLDAALARMPRLRDVSLTRQATELWGLSPVHLRRCAAVRRLALHDYWMDEYHAGQIVALFPCVEELVLACDPGDALVRDILDSLQRLRRLVIVRPCSALPVLASPAHGLEKELARRRIFGPGGEVAVAVGELCAPEENRGALPSWAAERIVSGECWALEGVHWATGKEEIGPQGGLGDLAPECRGNGLDGIE